MSILSIDVGRKSLGVCILCPAADTVLAWRVLEIAGAVDAPGVRACMESIVHHGLGVEHVVIERQPAKSMIMQRIQHYCEMLYTCMGKNVVVMPAKAKLVHAATTAWWPAGTPVTTATYRARKAAAVATAAAFVRERESSAQWQAFFEASPKRDDLADALLQALARSAQIKSTGTAPPPAYHAARPAPTSSPARTSQSDVERVREAAIVPEDAGTRPDIE